MGETEWHRLVCLLLWELATRWVAQRKTRAHVGSNQFVYWVQHEPTRSVAPDLYVLPGVDVGPEGLDVIKTWELGVPTLAVEVVSTDWRKDYRDGPRRYDELGIRELVIFDAKAPRAKQPERVRWQVFRRVARRGLVRVEATNADRIRSKVLGAWLREVGAGGAVRLRVASGALGDELVPTAEEERTLERDEAALARDEATRARDEATRARDEAARARDDERLRRIDAEADNARLRAELERRRTR